MTLRRKILVIVGVTLVALLAGLYAISSTVFLQQFTQLEQQDLHWNLRRATNALNDELASLDVKATEWSVWNDTYSFIEPNPQRIVAPNIGPSAFHELRLNLIVFLNRAGTVVFDKAFDLTKGVEVPVPEPFLSSLTNANPLLQCSDIASVHSGIVLLPEGPLLVVARPILTGRQHGPIRGTLIFGRFFDTAALQRAADDTQLALAVQRLDVARLPADFAAIRPALSRQKPVAVRPLSSQMIAGYSLWQDIWGRPALLLRVTLPRHLYIQGQATIKYLVSALVVIGLVFGLVTVGLLECLVLARLDRLITEVKHIGANGGFSGQVSTRGHDELAHLAQAINRMLAALRHSEADNARLSLAIEQAAETIMITDLAGKIVYTNPAFERVTGYPRTAVLGQTPRLLQSGQHDAAFYRELWATLQRGEVWSGHFINKRRDGTLFEEEAVISPVRDLTGQIVNYVAVKRDVTYERQVEEQFRQAQKMDAVGRLAGGVAHDFNNLLTAITGYNDLLARDLPAADRRHTYTVQIKKAVVRAADLTRQLLAFSRKQLLQPRVLNLNAVIADMAPMLRRLIGENIELRTIPAAALGPVKADPGQLEQIIMNLAVNARDAMPDGGTFTIATAAITLPPPAARPELSPGDDGEEQRPRCPSAPAHPELIPGDYVMLIVRDTGSGMTDDVKTHIFEPFFTTKDKDKGTGLGLATCYGIIKQTGGDISVETEPGQGTTFRIYLPRVEAPLTSPPATEKTAATPGGTETVLLVEDEPALREVADLVLSELGYTVLTAANGREALELVERRNGSPLHLLVTDVVMPQMGGQELARRLQVDHPDTKVLFTSGYTEDEVLRRGLHESKLAFLQKPYTGAILARAIREVLGS